MPDAATPDVQLQTAARRLAHAIPVDTAATRRAIAALCDGVPDKQQPRRLRELEDAGRIVTRVRCWWADADAHDQHFRLRTQVIELLAEFTTDPCAWVRRTVAAGVLQDYPERLMEGIRLPHHPVPPGTGATAIASARQAIHVGLLFGHAPADVTVPLEDPDDIYLHYRYVAGNPLDADGRYLVFRRTANAAPTLHRRITAYPAVPRPADDGPADTIDQALRGADREAGPAAHASRVAGARAWHECRQWRHQQVHRLLQSAGLEANPPTVRRVRLLPGTLLDTTAAVRSFVRDWQAPRAV